MFHRRLSPIPALLVFSFLTPLGSAQRLPLKTFTVADGLAHDEINNIRRDSRGFLWFCTGEGLSRFDGYTFVNFGAQQGLPLAEVNDFLETRDGAYWVGTDAGLARLNPSGKAEARVVLETDANPQAPPLFGLVPPQDQNRRARAANVLLEGSQGAIWVGTANGLYRLRKTGSHFELLPIEIGLPNEFPEQRFIDDLLEDRRHSLWIATPSGLYRRWPDGSAARYTKREGLPSNYLHCLLEDHTGGLWVGSRNHGFFHLLADETHRPPVVQSYAQRDAMPTWVYQLFETSDRHLWAAGNRGLYEYFPDWPGNSTSFRSYGTRNGISLQNVSSLEEDLAGNLWLGTVGGGAQQLAREGFVTYGEQDGVTTANSIFEDGAGGLCLRGYSIGPASSAKPKQFFGRFDGQRIQWFLPAALAHLDLGWVPTQVTLQAHNGEWWVGTGDGLVRFPAVRDFTGLKTARPLAIYTESSGLTNRQVYRLFEDSKHGIWVSTISSKASGLALWDPASHTFRNLADAPGLPSLNEDLAHSFAEDRGGDVWIGFGRGLACYRKGRFRFFSWKDGVPAGVIQEMHLDRSGRLWLASEGGGLIRVDHPTADRPSFTRYTDAQGLSSNKVSVITEDRFGRIYAGTGRALDRVDPATGQIKHFTTASGLPSTTFLNAFCDRNGELWFGGVKGLSRFVPALVRSPPPPVLLTRVRVEGALRSLSALGGTELTLPVLKAAENHLQIEYVGLSFVPGETLRYQYKLEGADSDWSLPTELRTVNYAGLTPGGYRFLVRAENSDGAMSPAAASVAFEILPPFWSRWWFLLLVATSIALLAYALHRYRLLRLLDLERMRTHIAANLHDDIGANLTQIAILSEVARSRTGQEDPQVATSLASIARISRESVASMGDIVWAINPNRDHLVDLVRRMRRFAHDVVANRGIRFQFRSPESEQDPKLGAGVRHDLFLVYKEALHNAARHSGCGKMDIELRFERSWLILTVADDGHGFDVKSASEGQGLGNMKRRAANMGGELHVRSSAGAGTEIVLKVPVRSH